MRQQIASVQILRAVAALLVVLHHVCDAWTERLGLTTANVFSAGAFGVDLFFVISGFIMCFTTAEMAQRSAFDFAVKRLTRIIPLYYLLTLAVFVLAMVAPALLSSTTASFENLIRSLLFIPYERADGRIFPVLALGWTINYEMFFYLIFTVALVAVRRHAHLAVILAMSGLVIAGFLAPKDSVLARFYLNDIILEFVWGCLLFKVWKRYPHAFRNLWPLAIVGLVLALTPVLAFMSLPRGFGAGIPAVLVVAGALGFAMPDTAASRFGVRLGDASYSIYLVHLFIVDGLGVVLARTLGQNWASGIVLMVLAVVIACAVSMAFYRHFEKPSNDWLRVRLLRLRPRMSEPSANPP